MWVVGWRNMWLNVYVDVKEAILSWWTLTHFAMLPRLVCYQVYISLLLRLNIHHWRKCYRSVTVWLSSNSCFCIYFSHYLEECASCLQFGTILKFSEPNFFDVLHGCIIYSACVLVTCFIPISDNKCCIRPLWDVVHVALHLLVILWLVCSQQQESITYLLHCFLCYC